MKTTKTKPVNPLVGKFFHSIDGQGYVEWQGRVAAMVEPGWYLVDTFEWIMGSPYDSRLVRISDMAAWLFYETDEEMRDSYEYGSAYQKRSPVSRDVGKLEPAEGEIEPATP